jgi:hypothetical protein
VKLGRINVSSSLLAFKAVSKNLLRCFGEAIQEKKDSKLAKRKHQFQKTLKLPF